MKAAHAQIVAGLDEGLLSMKPGGLRRMYIPGQLAYPKGLPSGPGRCSRHILSYAAQQFCSCGDGIGRHACKLLSALSGLHTSESPGWYAAVATCYISLPPQRDFLCRAVLTCQRPSCVGVDVHRPRVPPKSAVVFDVQLRYIPGA